MQPLSPFTKGDMGSSIKTDLKVYPAYYMLRRARLQPCVSDTPQITAGRFISNFYIFLIPICQKGRGLPPLPPPPLFGKREKKFPAFFFPPRPPPPTRGGGGGVGGGPSFFLPFPHN